MLRINSKVIVINVNFIQLLGYHCWTRRWSCRIPFMAQPTTIPCELRWCLHWMGSIWIMDYWWWVNISDIYSISQWKLFQSISNSKYFNSYLLRMLNRSTTRAWMARQPRNIRTNPQWFCQPRWSRRIWWITVLGTSIQWRSSTRSCWRRHWWYVKNKSLVKSQS